MLLLFVDVLIMLIVVYHLLLKIKDTILKLPTYKIFLRLTIYLLEICCISYFLIYNLLSLAQIADHLPIVAMSTFWPFKNRQRFD